MDHHYQMTLTDYVAIARRRAGLILGSFGCTLVVAVAVALLMPPVYRSAATILIESQQIPTELVQAAVTSFADERIEVIKQRVMTRDNLLRIIRKYRLFDDAGPLMTPSDQIDEMRKAIVVDLVNASLRPDRRTTATIAFSVSFEHRRAEVAQAVANDLVTLFLDENVKVRTQRATQTTEFLTQEAEKLKKELAGIETQIAAYKQQNNRALPENVALGMASMQRLEADLRQVERDYAVAEEELRALETERALPEAQLPAASMSELQRARMEVTRLAAMYTENHPDLRAAKRRVEGLEQAAAIEAAAPAQRAGPAGEVGARAEARSSMLRERLKVLAAQRGSLRGRLGQMDSALGQSPQVERGLAQLARDYQSAQRKYEEIQAKKMTAQVAENLEGDQMAERFAMLEPPTLPDKPIKPDRKKLLAMGLMLAFAVPVGAVSVVEALHGTLRGVGQISAAVGQKPLITIPVIPVAFEQTRRMRLWIALVVAGVVAAGAALALAHFFYLPLDLLFMKLLIRLG